MKIDSMEYNLNISCFKQFSIPLDACYNQENFSYKKRVF